MPEKIKFCLDDAVLGKVSGTLEDGLVKLDGLGEFTVGGSSFTIYPHGERHLCGLSGFDSMKGDECPACSLSDRASGMISRLSAALGFNGY